MSDPKAVFVIDALVDALDSIKAVLNHEDGTPEEVIHRVNEALRLADDYLAARRESGDA